MNVFFRNDWFEIPVEWNATGLGTYAAKESSERTAVWANGELAALHQKAKIVHFTGPVHPSMARVLDVYNQPYTAKPWGYAGAPGHPFVEEWRKVLTKTPWKDWFESEEYRKGMMEAERTVVEEGIEEFKAKIAGCIRSA
uniref:Uncharacterized protein n=1 Tax=Mycena chlorophos TaxID=658473 RepID=A0ABQ0L497_MYCCL|nr:predicted protein [Mycena chlorophos]